MFLSLKFKVDAGFPGIDSVIASICCNVRDSKRFSEPDTGMSIVEMEVKALLYAFNKTLKSEKMLNCDDKIIIFEHYNLKFVRIANGDYIEELDNNLVSHKLIL
ncbi:hypothetical protein ACH5RR_032336 [Cinchona calisaya]|uniref:Uncharacterized protein n=1 Tax=Cinchona calisaya TaxID=153742 RepID=A0ABD2YHS4_9GENT